MRIILLLIGVGTLLFAFPSDALAACDSSSCSRQVEGGHCEPCTYTEYYFCGYPIKQSQTCSNQVQDSCCSNDFCTVCSDTGFCQINGCPPVGGGGGGSVCGDGGCDEGESCSNCASDCGSCSAPTFCGDGACNGSESCSTCASDCGACPVISCGDGTCNGTETCSTCATDCSVCATANARARAVIVPTTATGCAEVTASMTYIPASFTLSPSVPNPPGAAQNAAGDGSYASWAGLPIPGGGAVYFLSSVVSSDYVLKLACWSRDNPAGNGTGTAAGLTANGSTVTWNVGYTLGTPWAQANGGDVYASGTIRSFVPPGAAPRVFTANGAGGYPGVVIYGTSYDFDSASTSQGAGYVSSQNWLVNAANQTVNYYEYFYRRFGAPAEPDTTAPFDNLLSVTQPASRETPYYAVGDMTTSGAWTIGAGESVVIVLDGNLTINGRITITGDGFLAFIVNGNITVDPSVGTTAASSTPVVEGVYVTSPTGTFATGASTAAATARFVGEGMFVAGNFSLGRDLEGFGSNTTTASELFLYNPQLLFSMPESMMEVPVTWQEAAP